MTAPLQNISINGRNIGPCHPPYIIAELSANHNGNIERAFAIMRASKEAGADAVKLQTYSADTMTIDHDGPGFKIESGLWKGRSLYDLYQEAGTPWNWHAPLFAYGKELGITVFSTPFDSSAVAFLEEHNVPAYKVASFELLDLPLIRTIAATGKPIIMSTGMADRVEIEEAVETARSGGCKELVVLHCVSAYPATPEDSNLKMIADLASNLNCIVGLSDHTLGVVTSIAGVALGANVIEKHVTLKRSDGGPDSAFSLEPHELSILCKEAHTAWLAIGKVDYKRGTSEEDMLILRRSLYAVEDIPKGAALNDKNIRAIRPGYGLPPKHFPNILGKKAISLIRRGTPLSFDLFD